MFSYRVGCILVVVDCLLWTVCFSNLYWQWHPWLQGHTWTHFKPENVMCTHHIILARNSIAGFWFTRFKVLYLYLHVEKVDSCNTVCDKVSSLSVITVSSKIWCGVHISYVFCCKDQIISLYLCIFGHASNTFTYIYGPSFITSKMVRCLLLLILQLGRLARYDKNTVVLDVCVNGFEVVMLWYLIYYLNSIVLRILWYLMYNMGIFIVSKSVVLSVNTYSTMGTVVSVI
jgi:hypothetical protein